MMRRRMKNLASSLIPLSAILLLWCHKIPDCNGLQQIGPRTMMTMPRKGYSSSVIRRMPFSFAATTGDADTTVDVSDAMEVSAADGDPSADPETLYVARTAPSATNEGNFDTIDTPFFAKKVAKRPKASKKTQISVENAAFEVSGQDLPENENGQHIPSFPSKSPMDTMGEVSRRQMLEKGVAAVLGTGIVAGAILNQPKPKPPIKQYEFLYSVPKAPPTVLIPPPQKMATTTSTSNAVPNNNNIIGKLAPVNLTQVAAETNINITMSCDDGCVQVDSKNFTKVKAAKLPSWYPSFLPTPSPKVIKQIDDRELLVAASIAGGVTDLIRTSVLYPIQTIKVRIQTDIHNYTASPPPIDRRIKKLGYNIKRFSQEGNLYAGIKPSLLVSVPATGVYYGVRDVSKRMLSMTPMGDIPIALTAALISDIVSLCFRTPADALTLRLQQSYQDEDDVGDWFGDSIKRLPMVIVTDLPYLLSKIFLTRQFIHGTVSVDQYAEIAIFTATVAAFLTTPFDVVRTRILVDSDGNFANGKDGGTGEGVIQTMKDVMREGRGGVANLYAGWFERVLYLGIGRAWLEPLQIIGYVGLRDALLLEWF